MRLRALLCTSIATLAALGAGAAGASGAAMFAGDAHTSHLLTGGTALLNSSGGVRITSGTATVNNCLTSTLLVRTVRNSGGVVAFTVIDGAFVGCINPMTATTGWTLEVAGSATMLGSTNIWGATATNVRADFLNGLLHGNLTSGFTIAGSTATGTGLCFVGFSAGTLTHPLTPVAKLDVTYCFTGVAANWALT